MNKKSLQEKLFLQSFKKRIPLYTVLEVSYNCNLNCVHCYIPSYYREYPQLTTQQLKKLICEIYSLGGLYLVFSGGEPLLRKDIFELMKYAKDLKFIVILFTNGSLITKEVAKKILETAVDRVEISVYGLRDIHNYFVGKNVFDKVMDGIFFLKNLGVKVTLKTVVTKININDYPKLKDLAKKLDLDLSVDFIISAKNDGDKSNCSLMLDEKQLFEFFKEEKIKFKFSKKQKDLKNIFCSAGFNVVTISPVGGVYPCVAFPYYLGNINKKSFKEIWKNNKFLKELNKNVEVMCYNCKLYNFCNRCVGICYVETGSLYGCSEVLKRVACVLAGM